MTECSPIDASVWVNADSPAETEHEASRRLLDILAANGSKIVLPTLLPVEIAGAIARTRGDPTLAGEMALALIALPNVRWVDLSQTLARHAADLAAKHRLRGADAVYAAVALEHSCTLISLDREHLTRLASIVRTLTPSDALAEVNRLVE